MKMLLLDDHTTPTMSATFTQSALLEHEVYLTDKLSHRPRERMHHLQCLVYVRPCPASIHALCQELLSPKYGAYWLYFSNVVAKHDIEALAEADQHQLVQAVQEFFSDYVPVTASHFTLQYDVPPHRLWGSHLVQWDPDAFEHHTSALLSLLLSLKKKPVVRYERMSALARKLADELVTQRKIGQGDRIDVRDFPEVALSHGCHPSWLPDVRRWHWRDRAGSRCGRTSRRPRRPASNHRRRNR